MPSFPCALSLSKGYSSILSRKGGGLAAMPVYLRYAIASAVALGVDMASFLALLDARMPAAAVSALGYAAGIAAHWLISSRLVFADNATATGAGRHRQKLLFVATAIVGLGTTVAVVSGATRLGLDPRLAKLVAIAASFQTGWLLRRGLVFA